MNSIDNLAAKHQAVEAEYKTAVTDALLAYAAKADLVDEDGNLDPDVLEDRLYEELRGKHVREIDEPDDRGDPTTSSSKTELTEAMFKAGPTAKDAEKSQFLKDVWAMASTAVWDLTRPGRRGRVQKRLESDRLLLIRGKVYRNGNAISTGVYVSTHSELVTREYQGPRLARLRNLIDAIQDDYEYATEIDKSLAAPMAEAIEQVVSEAIAKLPVNALGKGSGNGNKALNG
jgi:hypothetical protein